MPWVIAIVGAVLGVIGAAFAIRFYIELWKWARQCQHARIVVAHKNRVRLNAPLLEWLLWCNQLDEDKESNGRLVYAMGGTSIAVVKKSFTRQSPIRKIIKSVRPTRKIAPSVREGTWSAHDETKR